ncbi:MAG: glycosyltransferase [Cyanobacteria bacterium P01_A01_bin.45]
MKITIICHDIPYPHNHGGRVDMWRRIQAFAKFKVDLQLICWVKNQPSTQDILQMRKYVNDIYFINYSKGLKYFIQRLFDLHRYPLEVTSRIVKGQKLTDVLSRVNEFHPDIVWLDGLHGAELAFKISKHLTLPIFTRSHNIEHLYYQRLLNSAKGMDKIKRYLSLVNLKQYESYVLQNSKLFYDISVEDLTYWQNNGLRNGRYLPPIIEKVEIGASKVPLSLSRESSNLAYDIVFLGNLFANNNVASIEWFITQVLPIIRSQIPSVKVLIAGANPVLKIKQLCERNEGVELKINPTSVEEIYSSGKVLINPACTGSGVSIKSIEMLTYGRPIVSTPQGVCGLPEITSQYFEIANDAQSFAQKAIDCLLNRSVAKTDSKLLEQLFGSNCIQEVIHDVNSYIQNSTLAIH